ncbi:MAG TPA: bifunctional 4-hydroxy-2-oxoglutarate aldolase/2-dehydro-3-deoxy-phosphogluconate aldolase [Steroidobacteraceae bacterium]
MSTAEEILRLSPVMPVVTVDDARVGVNLAQALVRGGIRVIEVTLRKAGALQAIEAIARSVPDIRVGAGTVLSKADLNDAVKAGASFAISPGATPELLEAGAAASVPYIPAIATPSELMIAWNAGYRVLKFFPASVAGGPAMLKALAGPFPAARFCPTGGITPENARSYLELSNVLCVGGSWLAPSAALATGDWGQIEALARQAASLRTGS